MRALRAALIPPRARSWRAARYSAGSALCTNLTCIHAAPCVDAGKAGAGMHGSATETSGQGGVPVRFVNCLAHKVDRATLTRGSSGQGQENLTLEMHHCDAPNCPIARVGGWKRGFQDVKARMRKDGENFTITNLKDRSIKEKLVLA